MRTLLGATLLLILFMACNDAPPEGKGAGEVATAGATSFRVETFASGLQVPWSIVFVPDGRVFVTERPGRVRVIENGQLRTEPLATISDVEARSESGLMGMTLHPQFASNHQIYLCYAYDSGSGQRDRVVRFRETGNALTERKVIIEDIPAA